MEQTIIPPVERALLKQELTSERQLRMTNKSHNEIYIVDIHNSPNTLREIGRLREIAFRAAGGGTGKELDLDEFDLCDNCYKQLIVWNPESEDIIGGYRYILGTDIDFDSAGQPILATSHMFHFSEKFIREYLPQTIELGRSFVSLPYQNTNVNGTKSTTTLSGTLVSTFIRTEPHSTFDLRSRRSQSTNSSKRMVEMRGERRERKASPTPSQGGEL